MADINNFAEITENFDTIKTLLNSIRAQGILNTSDVDKLLSGINSKLEKINTEEDIDLIKIFLSELKQNLDERHSVLLSKFGAIESLFSNLLKNSSETLKSSEVKELFDIVATNLSVFSREVVSQKETLSDITLRLDAMRSDDSQKREIIKSVGALKTDLERLNNGFDSIVLSLNENFKTLTRNIAEVDQSESINKFEKELNEISNSSGTILSALQMIDKKNLQIEDSIKALATQDDISGAKRAISELAVKNQELVNSVDVLSEKYYKIDNLAEKIDASVSIIASMKALLEDRDEQNIIPIIDKLEQLEAQIKDISSDSKFDEFKFKLESVLNDITADTKNLQDILTSSSEELKKIGANIKALDLNTGFQTIITNIHKTELDIKSHVDMTSEKVTQLVDVGVTRTLNEISSNADALNSNLKEAQSALAALCEKSFSEVTENIAGLKSVVAQIDENNVSANNAIFSNITDRLAIFENSLKTSLDKQEDYVANSSSKLVEEIANLKNLAGVLDYKLDSSVMDVNNAKREFEGLKSSIDGVLELDFVNKVKDLRVDLYAVKQDITTAVETFSGELGEKFTKDLFGKYELLISKLDNVEDELKQVQASSLTSLKSILDNISSSLVDILSYVSVSTGTSSSTLDVRLADITEAVKNNNLDYIESVRDIVDVIRIQVENNLSELEKDTAKKIETINSSITKNTETIRDEIKYSYNKLLEVQDDFNEVKEAIGLNGRSLSSNYENIISNTDALRQDFELKMSALKNALLESVTDFKKEFTCENADKISELKFSSENLHSKSVQHASDLKNELKQELTLVLESLKLNVKTLSEQLVKSVSSIEGSNKDVVDYIKNEFCSVVDTSIEAVRTNICDFTDGVSEKIDGVTDGFDKLEASVSELSTNTTTALSSTLAQILDNFVSLKALMNTLNESASIDLGKNVDKIIQDFAQLKETVKTVDANIDEDLTRQLSIIESGFETLTERMVELLTNNNEALDAKIEAGLTDISSKLSLSLQEKLEQYKSQVENLFDSLQGNSQAQSEFIKERITALNSAFESAIAKQNQTALAQIQSVANKLKAVLDENIELTSADYDSLKKDFSELAVKISDENKSFIQNLQSQMEDVVKFIDSGFEINTQEVSSKFDDISSDIKAVSGVINELNGNVQNRVEGIRESLRDLRGELSSSIDVRTQTVIDKLEEILKDIISKNEEINSAFSAGIKSLGNNLSTGIKSGLAEQNKDFGAVIEKQTYSIIESQKEVSDRIQSAAASAKDELNLSLITETATLGSNIKNDIEKYGEELHSVIEEQSSVVQTVQKETSKEIQAEIAATKDGLNSSLAAGFSSVNSSIKNIVDTSSQNIDRINTELEKQAYALLTKQDEITKDIEANSTEITEAVASSAADVISSIKSLSDVHAETLGKSIEDKFSAVKILLEDALLDQNKDIVERSKENLETALSNQQSGIIAQAKDILTEMLFKQQSDILEKSEKFIQTSFTNQQSDILTRSESILKELQSVYGGVTKQLSVINTLITDNLSQDVESLYEKIQKLQEEHSLNLISGVSNTTSKLINEMEIQSSNLKKLFDSLHSRLDKDEISQMNLFQTQLKELSETFNTLIEEAKTVTKEEVSSISETLIGNSKAMMEDVEQSIEEKVNSILAASADIAAGELQTIEAFADKILKQVENTKQNSLECRDIITALVSKSSDIIIDNIEKETDVIVKDLIEQFNLIRDAHKDELSKMTIHVESSVEDYIYTHISDLKSYLDVKTDSSIVNTKLDNLKTDIDKSVEDVLDNISRLINAGADSRAANEILITSMTEKINESIQSFVNVNVSQRFDERFNLLDKKFIDTIVDKYEEIKLISARYNDSFETIQGSIQNLVSGFVDFKEELISNTERVLGSINNSIEDLSVSFADLKAQILNKSFDEAFQASLNNQISGIESLVNEQLGYLNDISELCCTNLPELTEMNTIVKYGILQSISDLKTKIDEQDSIREKDLNELKSDIITQILNIFNQISFVTEQEEILDFIQEKHSDLITILSHIVTSVDTVSAMDTKVNSIKDEIGIINKKIASIISSDGDVDYVYSLQDLESDIANLRLVLNEMKEDNKSKEFAELISSTNNIYKLVETIKTELPKFEIEEFKHEFDSLQEDIVSISTRTNKLILASDESYKTLQDNLQDFKLVINDLDERTRNFAHEAGIDRIDDKLGSISSMIHSGAKTNQVFNQVFEYLAEWVDKAGEQISTISDKVETLDDIGQIKVMLEDLKAEAEDNTDSVELIEALSNVFDKQAKRISSLEAKLDRVIVETTISNKNNKIDLSPFEETLNRFLVAIDDKMAEQQAKIDSLEEKLEEVVSKIDPKDTAQLTKKVGGMDRQIAKLNKSIEKIASHVVEK